MYGKFFYYNFQNALTKKTCSNIIKKYNRKKQKAKVGKTAEVKKTRNSSVNLIRDKNLYNLITPIVTEANKKANWNFEIDWVEDVQFTSYKKGEFYDWHQDYFDEPYKCDDVNFNNKIRKLSCCINLYDPKKYKGGQLELKIQREKTEVIVNPKEFNNEQGSIIVFPSHIFHRVTPIISGKRYSLVSWFLGYPFK